MATRYWDEKAETMPRPEIAALQLTGLRQAIDRALKTPFYRPRLEGVGISSPADIKSLADLDRIPFTTKDDLR